MNKKTHRGNNWYVWKIKNEGGDVRFSVTYEFQKGLVEKSLEEDEKLLGSKTLSEALGDETNIYAFGIHSQESEKFRNPENDES